MDNEYQCVGVCIVDPDTGICLGCGRGGDSAFGAAAMQADPPLEPGLDLIPPPRAHTGEAPRLPPQIRVLERGWLSSNNVVFLEGPCATVVDSGYVSHAAQTVELVHHALAGRRLARLINTHGHSDHIGGNAALVRAFGCTVTVPAALAPRVAVWDEDALLLSTAAQDAEPFTADATFADGELFEMGGMEWRALAVPGHDMDALAFYCERARLLISGDALWEDGFGIVFPEVMGTGAGLAGVRRTLELLGRLAIDVVIPGHGPAFADVPVALERAWKRVAAFEAEPERMARNALRACFTFALMDRREMPLAAVPDYLASVPLYRRLNERYFRQSCEELARRLLQDLERAGVVSLSSDRVVAAGGA